VAAVRERLAAWSIVLPLVSHPDLGRL
jgi:hypothetical protein